jgi:hypothetical protein
MRSSLEGIFSSQREMDRVFREWASRAGWGTPAAPAAAPGKAAEPDRRDATEPDAERLREEVATLRERLRALEERLEKRKAEEK